MLYVSADNMDSKNLIQNECCLLNVLSQSWHVCKGEMSDGCSAE